MEPIKYRRPRWTPLAVFCLILTWNDRIQSFWELTYKFPGGLKTGIALAVLSLLLTLNGRTQSFWELTYEFPGGPKTGIALAKDSCLFVGLLTGIIRSCDEGYSFENALQSTSIATVFASRSAKVFAGGAGRIYASNNLGETWDSVSLPTVYPVLQIIDTPNGGLFAITGADIGLGGDGVFYSADNGRTWVERNNGLSRLDRNCQRIVADRKGRLYLAVADEYATGGGGLFISENDGLWWERVQIVFDGKGNVENQLRIISATGLSISPQDSLYISFEGRAGNALVRLNLHKHLNAIKDHNRFWTRLEVFNSVNWWEDRMLNNIYFSSKGLRLSSVSGPISQGATYLSSDKDGTWQRIDAGLGANILGMRHSQYFVEKSNGRLFMVQYLDERIYKLKADRPTPVKTPARPSFPLKIYPNPVAPGQPFYIDKPSGLPNYQIDIFDAAGRRHEAIQSDDMRTPVNAPATPGIYFIRVDTGNKGRTLQLIVQ
jgi:hypothetical protein